VSGGDIVNARSAARQWLQPLSSADIKIDAADKAGDQVPVFRRRSYERILPERRTPDCSMLCARHDLR
jgi:hypothetical protein